jgi:hypothetical protein
MGRKIMRRQAREITDPEPPAPPLVCPTCDVRLTFRKTIISGVAPVERWDQFVCPRCTSDYDYRHRTKQLRRGT